MTIEGTCIRVKDQYLDIYISYLNNDLLLLYRCPQ